jgi:hypothetical protein
LFGSPQYPGQLYFDNVELSQIYRDLLTALGKEDRLAARQAVAGRRTAVMLSRQRRAARPDHLFTNELVWASLPLTGRIVGEVISGAGQDAQASRDDLALLWGALGLVTHLGRARSRGLGQCTVEVISFAVAGVPFTTADLAATLQMLGEGATR